MESLLGTRSSTVLVSGSSSVLVESYLVPSSHSPVGVSLLGDSTSPRSRGVGKGMEVRVGDPRGSGVLFEDLGM